MSRRRRSARDAAKPRNTSVWIEHAFIEESDLEWLSPYECLTLLNVQVPRGFLAKLKRMWCLDLRGGSASDLSIVEGSAQLRFLGVRSVRGVQDVSALTELRDLEYLQVNGLHHVKRFPSLAMLRHLERVEIGPMRGLESLGEVLDAPALRELYLLRRIAVSEADIKRINSHPTIEQFDWNAEDVPVRLWKPVLDQITLPRARVCHPHEWFERRRTNESNK